MFAPKLRKSLIAVTGVIWPREDFFTLSAMLYDRGYELQQLVDDLYDGKKDTAVIMLTLNGLGVPSQALGLSSPSRG